MVLDSKDRQGNLWLPQNAPNLTTFTILIAAKTCGKLVSTIRYHS